MITNNQRNFIICSFLGSTLFVGTISQLHADDFVTDVDKDMQRLKTAMLSKDSTSVVSLMFEPIVEASGGKELVLAQCKQLMSTTDTASFDVKKPYTYYM